MPNLASHATKQCHQTGSQRAEDDYGVTYILDESFGYLFRYKSQFPKWFVEAVEEVEDVEDKEAKR